jgi:SPP1 family phage portal protein
MSLQDALNKLISDNVNDWEAFVDSYLILTGMSATQPEDIAKMRQDRILLLEGESSAEWLTKQVQHDHIKELKDSMTRKIRDLGNTPDLENLGSFGASGVALRFKLLKSEIQASKQERVLQRGIQRKLELLYNILRITDPAIGNYTDVKIIFERNFVMIGEDRVREMQVDIQLIDTGIMTRERFLIKYEGMTPEEARAELRNALIEDYERGGVSDMGIDWRNDIRPPDELLPELILKQDRS